MDPGTAWLGWTDPCVILMCIIRGQILNYAAAEINIDNLHALTNPQDRPGKANKSIQHGKLLPVKPRFNFPGAMVALSKQNRIDIAAPGRSNASKSPANRQSVVTVHEAPSLVSASA